GPNRPCTLLGGERQKEAAVVVVGREEVGDRRPVLVQPVGPERAVDAEHPDAPLDALRGGVVALPAGEAEPVHHLVPDEVALAVARDLEGGVPGSQDAALLVADDQRGARARVVVLQQFEEEPEPATLTSASAMADRP